MRRIMEVKNIFTTMDCPSYASFSEKSIQNCFSFTVSVCDLLFLVKTKEDGVKTRQNLNCLHKNYENNNKDGAV